MLIPMSTGLVQGVAGEAPGSWDVSTSVFNNSFSVSANVTTSRGIFFKPDGAKFYIVDQTSADISEYSLSTAWDISTSSYVQAFSVSSQGTSTISVYFKPDGMKMYIVGQGSDNVSEYDLSTAWDISTASFVQNFSVNAQDTAPSGLFFKSDGLKMYVSGTTGDDVNEYTLSTAWDVSTASFVQNFSISAQENTPLGLHFKPDGLTMYIVGQGSDNVNEYDLSTAWDISTASFNQAFSVSSQETLPSGLFFRDDGLKMYVSGPDGDDVNEYDLGA